MPALALLIGLVLGACATALLLRGRLLAAARLGPQLASLQVELARAERDLEHAQSSADERLTAMRETFGAISAEALARNNAQFLELAKSTLATTQVQARGDLDERRRAVAELVRPIADSLAKVQGGLEKLEADRRESHGALGEQLRALAQTHERLRGETGALVAALRQPQARGRWGETQLRRVVELAGMVNRCDFVEQASVEGDEGRLRPDLVVSLPGGKTVIVDAKTPLHAFLDAYESDESQRELHLRAHARLVREHVRKLSARSYWSQFDSAPDFVLLFLPGEHFLNAALEVDPGLLDESVQQSVLIATPMTLITLLRAVRHGWQQEQVAEGAREIGRLGRELHERLATFANHLQGVGKRLSGAVGAYNDAVGSLEARVLPSARRLAEHGAVSEAEELARLAPIEVTARPLQAAELVEALDAGKRLEPAALRPAS